MGQFEPSARKRIRKGLGVLVEIFGNGAVKRIHTQCEVCCEHDRRMALACVVSIWHGLGGAGIGRDPLRGPRWAFGFDPFIAKQSIEIGIVPGCRCFRPSAFKAARDSMGPFAAFESVFPAKTQIFDGCGFGLGADKGRVTCAVGFTKRVSTCDQGHRFFVVHRHARKGFTNINRGSQRIRIAVRPFGVNIDQAHLYRRQWVFQIAFAAIAIIAEPFIFCAPIDVFLGLPHIGTPACEAKGFEPHRFKRAISRENHQISPRDLSSIFLLERPKQAACLVKIAVVWPAVKRRKTLHPRASTPAPIARAVGTRRVPRHADEKWPVMAVIRRPPLL